MKTERRLAPSGTNPHLLMHGYSLKSHYVNSVYACLSRSTQNKSFAACVEGILSIMYISSLSLLGTAVAQWLRRCATNWKVGSSIPDGVTGIFQWRNLSDRTMSLGSTPPLTEISTRGKCGWSIRLTNLPPSSAVVMKSGNLNFLESSGPLQACNGIALPLPLPCLCSKYNLVLFIDIINRNNRLLKCNHKP
jgi:hypothetical protein